MGKKYTGHCACGQVTYGFDTSHPSSQTATARIASGRPAERWRHSGRCLTRISPCSAETPRASPTVRIPKHVRARGSIAGSVANYRKQESWDSQVLDFPIHDFRIVPRKGNFATEPDFE